MHELTCVCLLDAEDELNSKLASRDAITNEIAEIQAAQQSVNTLAADDLTLFTHNINLLGSTWLQASADAQAALDYLNDANNATIPFVWTIYAKKDVSICKYLQLQKFLASTNGRQTQT